MKIWLQQWLNRLVPTIPLRGEEGEYDSGRHVALLIPCGLLYGLDYHPCVWIYDER